MYILAVLLGLGVILRSEAWSSLFFLFLWAIPLGFAVYFRTALMGRLYACLRLERPADQEQAQGAGIPKTSSFCTWLRSLGPRIRLLVRRAPWPNWLSMVLAIFHLAGNVRLGLARRVRTLVREIATYRELPALAAAWPSRTGGCAVRSRNDDSAAVGPDIPVRRAGHFHPSPQDASAAPTAGCNLYSWRGYWSPPPCSASTRCGLLRPETSLLRRAEEQDLSALFKAWAAQCAPERRQGAADHRRRIRRGIACGGLGRTGIVRDRSRQRTGQAADIRDQQRVRRIAGRGGLYVGARGTAGWHALQQ